MEFSDPERSKRNLPGLILHHHNNTRNGCPDIRGVKQDTCSAVICAFDAIAGQKTESERLSLKSSVTVTVYQVSGREDCKQYL